MKLTLWNLKEMCSYYELKNCTKGDKMLSKMSKKELIDKVKELEDEIETLHEELRMVYNENIQLEHDYSDLLKEE